MSVGLAWISVIQNYALLFLSWMAFSVFCFWNKSYKELDNKSTQWNKKIKGTPILNLDLFKLKRFMSGFVKTVSLNCFEKCPSQKNQKKIDAQSPAVLKRPQKFEKISHLFWHYWVKTDVLSKKVGDFFKFYGLTDWDEL